MKLRLAPFSLWIRFGFLAASCLSPPFSLSLSLTLFLFYLLYLSVYLSVCLFFPPFFFFSLFPTVLSLFRFPNVHVRHLPGPRPTDPPGRLKLLSTSRFYLGPVFIPPRERESIFRSPRLFSPRAPERID